MAQIRIYTTDVELTFTETETSTGRITLVEAVVTYQPIQLEKLNRASVAVTTLRASVAPSVRHTHAAPSPIKGNN